MKKVTIVFLALALLAACAWAYEVKEEQELVTFTEDVSPDLGPVAPITPYDTPWDTLFTLNAQLTSTNLLLGVAHAGGYFWTTGAGNSSAVTTDNKYYRYTNAGAFVDSFVQPTNSGWGWRDLVFDGTYLYAGCEVSPVVAFDPTNGALVPTMNIPKPAALAIARALAYDPVSDHFWGGNFGSNLVEFDRAGNVIWQGSPSPSTSVYGLAWDSDPDGPWLWVYDQTTPGTTIRKYNPATHTYTGEIHTLPLMPGNTAGTAGGAEMNSTWNPSLWTMVCMVQGTPADQFCVVEVRNNANPLAPAAPDAFTLINNGELLMATLTWTNPSLTVNGQPLTTIDSLVVKRNGAFLLSLQGSPGQAMNLNDNVPVVGNYSYQIYAVNSFGDGIPVGGSAWIGLDTPGPATGVTATSPANLQVLVSWTAPTAGAHQGYWPAGSWDGQKIYRNGTLLTTLTGTNTSYTDNLADYGVYTYGVAYFNASGDGPTVNAPPLALSPYQMTSTPYNWIEINPNRPGGLAGINSGLNGDDQNLGPFPLGMNFTFFGTTFNTVRMCSNGFASFTSTSTALTNATIPAIALPNDLLAVYWDDLLMSATGGGAAFYYYDAVNGRFIMEWDTVEHYSSTITGDTFTFEIILHANGIVDYMYKDIVPGTFTPFPSATAGIENATGTLGNLATFNGSGPIEPAPLTGIRFQPWTVNPDLQVWLNPIGLPIQIPANGGAFNFEPGTVNNGPNQTPFSVWARIKYPDGTYTGYTIGPVTLDLPVGTSIQVNRTQTIPADWPTGIYTYLGYAGLTVSYPALDSATFEFEKLAAPDGGPTVWEAICYGEPFPGEVIRALALTPNTFTLKGASPNPFNPTTNISFTLPEVSDVTLRVFDVSGRQVAQILHGVLQAGSHQVTFDGSNLASGIYLYTLNAGSHKASGKMVLLK
jgi:hypothetical protein